MAAASLDMINSLFLRIGCFRNERRLGADKSQGIGVEAVGLDPGEPIRAAEMMVRVASAMISAAGS
jgi:hypothetical protein